MFRFGRHLFSSLGIGLVLLFGLLLAGCGGSAPPTPTLAPEPTAIDVIPTITSQPEIPTEATIPTATPLPSATLTALPPPSATQVPAAPPSATPPPSGAGLSGLTAHSIAFVGCSNTEQAVQGYLKTPGNRNLFWNVQDYRTWGGTIDLWADTTSQYWPRFTGALQRYGQPKVIWVQLCEQYHARPVDFSTAQTMLANIKQLAPSAVYYLSAINSYSPNNICPFMGPNGQGETDTNAWRDQLVAAGQALRGPDMGPLTVNNTIGNHCHMDDQGMLLEGGELYNFFDKGK